MRTPPRTSTPSDHLSQEDRGMRRRAAWISVVGYIVVSAALLGLTACVSAQPFEPEMCVMRADSLYVEVSQKTMQLCALPLIRTKVEK